jgi:hypothetical protein
VLVAACGSKKEKRSSGPAAERPGQPTAAGEPGAANPTASPTAEASPFPADTRSLELVRTVAVRLEPGDDMKRIGTIAVDTRVRWRRTASGKGCTKPWVEMEPRGWICSDHVKPSTKPAYGREVPLLERGTVIAGDYGRISTPNMIYTFAKPDKKRLGPKDTKDTKRTKSGPITSPSQVDPKAADAKGDGKGEAGKLVEDKPILGTLTIRIYEELTVDGKLYYRIDPKLKEYVLASQVRRLKPSDYMGSRLGDDTGWALPFGFIWPRSNWTQAWTFAQPNRVQYRQINARTPVPILETHKGKDGKPDAYRIAAAEWVNARDVRVFHPAAPPSHLRPAERWIDIDLDAQILVAFEGDMPIYSTLVSSGLKDTATTPGIYRIWLKDSEADMKNLKAEDPYSVATVPWTQFFYAEEDLALHTAYWHDNFGQQRSHGCVNLAPRDARWLYYWSDPQVAPGWTSTTGVAESPGSVVRVRSAAVPEPEWKGYAKKVLEARQANAPVH